MESSDCVLKKFGKSILFKIGITLILLTSLILAGFGMYQYQTRRSRETVRLKVLSEAVVERLAVNLVDPLWNYADEQIEKVIHSEMREVSVSAIVVRDALSRIKDGKVRDTEWNSIDLTGEISPDGLSQSAEIKNAGRILGTVEVFVTTRFMEEELNRAVNEIIITIVGLDVLLFVLLSFSVRVILVKPIKRLLMSAWAIATGDFTHEIDIRQHDEIGDLADAFRMILGSLQETVAAAEAIAAGNLQIEVRERSEQDRLMQALNRMIRKLKDISSETEGMIKSVAEGKLDVRGNAEAFEGGWRELVGGVNNLLDDLSGAVSTAAAMSQEMELAKKIQTSLLPVEVRDIHPDFEIAATMIPADEVGGDYYDIVFDGENILWVGIGDVSGHGLTPGMIMMMTQTIHTAIIMNYHQDPAEAVSMVNKVLYQNVHGRLKEHHHMTFTLLKYKGGGEFVHAGAHLPMIVYRAGQKKCEFVETTGVFLNFLEDIADVTENSEFMLDVGDILVLYTDGLTEANNSENVMLEEDRLAGFMGTNASESVEDLRDSIMESVLDWCGNKRDDDMTLVVIRRKQ